MTDQPCAKPDSNPDDWFIGKDGRQYPDDTFLTQAERDRIAKSVLRKADEVPEDHERRVRRAVNAAENDRKRRAIQRRRHAKEACHRCPAMIKCLELAIDSGVLHGTWGGLYEEEVAELRSRMVNRA